MKSFGKYVLFGTLVLLIASVLAVVGHSIGLFPVIEPHVLLSFALGSTVGKVIVDHWM